MRSSTSIGARAYGKIDADHQAQLQAKRQARRRVGIIVACSLLLLAAIVAVTVGVIISKRNSSGHGDGDDDSSSSSTAQFSTGVKAIQTACNATSYPDLCVETLTNSSEALSADPLHLVIIASQLALRGVRQAYNLSVSLISGHGYSSPLEHAAIEDCSELLDLAADEIEDSIARLESLDLTSFAKALRNVEIVLSTASSLQAGCSDGLVNITGTAAMQLGAKQEDVDKLIIIALGLVEALASLGSSLSSWKSSLPSNATGSLPFGLHFRRRRLLLLSSDSSSSEAADANDGFPDWVTPMGRRILQSSADSSTNSSDSSTNSTASSTNSTSSSSNSTASSTWDAVVGPGETFTTIAQALASVPSSDSYPSGERYTIYIKSGTYDEGPLNVSKALVNLTLLGDGCGKTIVRGFASVSGANNTLGSLSVTTYRSATLGKSPTRID
jgi:pectinesterase inhibitor-like protein